MSQRILIVDDEKDILESLALFLGRRMPRAHVETATSGERAQERIQAERFDLVITDHRMPGMSGLQLATWIRAHDGPPTVMCTAYPDMDLAIRACNEGHVDAFFTKPFDPAALLDAVRVASRRRRRREQRHAAYQRAESAAARIRR